MERRGRAGGGVIGGRPVISRRHSTHNDKTLVLIFYIMKI